MTLRKRVTTRKATVALAVSPQVARLVGRLQRKILKAPMYRQNSWAEALATPKRPGKAGTRVDCQTAACLAGEAVMLHPQFEGFHLYDEGDTVRTVLLRDRATMITIQALAAEMLGCGVMQDDTQLRPGNTCGMAPHLFHPDPAFGWPEPFAAQWARTKNSHYGCRARIAVKRLEHFKVTGQ